MLDEIEQRRLGPVDVLEDDEQRPFARERLEQAPHGPEELLRRSRSAAAERAEALDHERGVGLVAHRVRHGLLAAEPLDELRQRPEGDPVAVGEAAPGGDGRVLADLGDELGHEPRLADAGRADHRHQPALAPLRARRQLVSKERELARPPDERRVPAAGERIGAGDGVEHAPGLDGSALALRLDTASSGSSRDGMADEPLA